MLDRLIALDDDTQQLISILHRGGNYSFFQRLNGDDKCSYWRRYGKTIEFPADILEKYNFFFGVNPATVRVAAEDREKHPDLGDDRIASFVGTKNSTIASLNCLYAEFDGKDYTFPSDNEVERIFQSLRANPDKASANDATLQLEAAGMAKEAKYSTNPQYYRALAREHIEGLAQQPSVIVDSGGGYQAYWLADKTFVITSDADRERAASLQKRWVMFVCGDPSVHDLRRILRVPGSRNWKKRYAPDYPLITFIKKDFDLCYSLDELETLLPPEEIRQAPQRTNGTYYTNGDGRESFIDSFNASNSIVDVLLAHGYTWAGKDRMNRPGSDDSKGVVIYANDNESYHHSGGDPLHNGYRMKPFNVVCKLDYNDDAKEAVRALKGPSMSSKQSESAVYAEVMTEPTAQPTGAPPAQPTGDLDLALLAIRSIAKTAEGLNEDHRKTLFETLTGIVGNLSTDDKKIALLEINKYVDNLDWFIDLLPITSEHLYIKSVRKMGYTFRLNKLEDTVEVDGKSLDDIKRSEIYIKAASYKIAKTYVDDAINVLAAENSYHPVQDYLYSLVWDKENHFAKLITYIQGDDKTVTYGNGQTSPLYAALIYRWLLGCVARALDGDKEIAFKHQTPVLTFIGAQGIGKSSLVRWLVSTLGYEFHRESPVDPHNADHIRSMVIKWIWEISELSSSLRKNDRDAFKGFVTQEWHTYRKPYGRSNITKPTLCNFVGTVNSETGFLDDPTGHRRFLPVNITEIKKGYEQAIDVNQLWAQIVYIYRQGESPELAPAEKEALKPSYKEHEVENPLQTYLRMYFRIEPGNQELKISTAEIIMRLRAFGINLNNNLRIAGREINDAATPMGLERSMIYFKDEKVRGWIGIAPTDERPPSSY